MPGSSPAVAAAAAASQPVDHLGGDRRAPSHRGRGSPPFALDLSRVLAGGDPRTTLMVRNIPNKYTQRMLLQAVDEHLKGGYDFFYLPIDFKNKCNVGYAFVNVVRPDLIAPLVRRFDGRRWDRFNSEKVCAISYARIQGKGALVSHFQNSSLLHEDRRCRPILFKVGPDGLAGEPEPFPAPTTASAAFAAGGGGGAVGGGGGGFGASAVAPGPPPPTHHHHHHHQQQPIYYPQQQQQHQMIGSLAHAPPPHHHGGSFSSSGSAARGRRGGRGSGNGGGSAHGSHQSLISSHSPAGGSSYEALPVLATTATTPGSRSSSGGDLTSAPSFSSLSAAAPLHSTSAGSSSLLSGGSCFGSGLNKAGPAGSDVVAASATAAAPYFQQQQLFHQ